MVIYVSEWVSAQAALQASLPSALLPAPPSAWAQPHQGRAKISRVLPHSQIWLERPLRRSLPLHLQDSSKPLSNPCSHLQSIVLHVPFVLFSCISEFWLERFTVNYIYNIIPLQSNCRKQTHLELSYKLKESLPDSTRPALQNAVFTYTRRCCTKRNQYCSVQN